MVRRGSRLCLRSAQRSLRDTVGAELDMTTLLTPQQAADAMGVSKYVVERLINDAQTCPRTAKWREKRDFIDLTPAGNVRRIIRIMPQALGLPVSQVSQPTG